MKRALPLAALLISLALLALGCRKQDGHGGDGRHGEKDSGAGQSHQGSEPWAVTAWSEHYELFAETEPLIAGAKAPSHAHFTYLPDFSALNEGSVTGVLRNAAGEEETFLAAKPTRAGIFTVVFEPRKTGTFDLFFRVANDKASEEIAAGSVEVGTAAVPGGAVETSGLDGGASGPVGDPISFLKEQQWRTPFATAVVREGSLHASLRAPATVIPAGDGEVTVTAPTDGTVTSVRWPHAGRAVDRGATLFVVSPRIALDKSRAVLESEVAELEAELGTHETRRERLRELLAVEAVSRREVEEVDARVRALSARLEASRRDLANSSAIRGGTAAGAPGRGTESFRVVTPIGGQIAQVWASPGQFVTAGTPLARVVRTSPVWLSLALSPQQASELTGAPAGLSIGRWAGDDRLVIAASDLRLVSRAPEIKAATGTVEVIFEVRRAVDSLRLGSRADAEVLLAQELKGLVAPAESLVDDSGVEVIYVQLEGESFERRVVEVLAREGDLCLVRGLRAGERIVTRGGNAVRRSALLGSGAIEGHVH